MGIKNLLLNIRFFKDQYLYDKYRGNIHDIDLNETIKTGIVDRLMDARELGIPYCVVFGNVVPAGDWDPYKSGKWNPPRDYIGTDDIETDNNDREQEKQNIYSFLRGEAKAKKDKKTK